MRTKLFLMLLFFVFLINFVSAEIVSLDKTNVYPGDIITLTIKPTKLGFYNIIYIHKDLNVVDLINIGCSTICTKVQRISYTVPANFLGGYYFATFDYALNDYELDYFNVLEAGDSGGTSGSLIITDIKNVDSGTTYLINPEQGKNANILISADVKAKNCEGYNLEAYMCNSSLVCNESVYNYYTGLSFVSKSGTTCSFRYTGEDFFPFYKPADNWKLIVKSGALINEWTFVYTSLAAINYTSAINFGGLNAKVWNIGVPEISPKLINFGNVPLLVDWNCDGFSCISENCTSFWKTYDNGENTFQIDDDDLFMEENETDLEPVFITNFTLNYFPQNNLPVCISDFCNNSIGENIPTYFNLKLPEIQRGVYQGDIRVSLY